VGFLSIFILAGHVHRIGLPFLAPLANLVDFRLNLSFEQTWFLAATIYHAGVVMSQVGNALACRSDHMRSSSLGWLSNKYLLIGILMELVGIASIIYIPFLNKIFNHTPLSGWMWIGLGLNTVVLYSVEWLRKAIVRGLKNMRNGKTTTLALQEVSR
jgi:magnesium-transporting ATPase (P-type)